MKTFLKNSFLLLMLTAASSAWGQPGGNLGQIELSVTEKYKAEVGEAVKLSESPDFEDTTTQRMPVNYRISSQPIEVQYTPEPISPARIARVPVDELYQGMARLGFGLYVTPLAEAYWNSGRSSEQSFGFWGKHFSTQSGAPTIFDNNALSQSELGGYFNRFYRNMKWETQALASWDKYSYYGIDDFPPIDSLDFSDFEDDPEDPATNWYRLYELNTALSGKNESDLGWLDRIGLNMYNFTDARQGREDRLRLNSQWQLPAGENDLDIDLNLSWFNVGFDSASVAPESTFLTGLFDSVIPTDQSHFTVQARPKVDLVLSGILFNFGLNIYANNYRSDLTGGKFQMFFFPDLQLRVPFVEDVLSAYAGVKGQIQHNSFRHLTNDNPYITPAFNSRPTRTTDLFIGMEGIISSTTSFNVRGGYMLQKDLALYYREPNYRLTHFVDSLRNLPSLQLLYDNVETFYARGELAMNINNNLQAVLFGELRSYNTNDEAEAWHLPSFMAGLNLDYTFREKIKLGTEWNYMGKREAFVQDDNPRISSTLPAYLDVNLKFEYLYNSRLSGFLNVSNLLNQKYDLYMGYKAQKINFLMGFAYKF